MAENKSHRAAPAKSLAELVEFFETYDMGGHFEQMPEVNFDVNIKRRTHLVAIDEDLVGRLAEIAKSNRVSTEKLINSWLKEKIRERKTHP